MAKVIMKVEGIDGQIALLNDRIVITRDGLLNVFSFGFNSRREIPLSAISEVMFRNATVLKPGQIEFVRSGRSQDERKSARQSAVKFRKLHAARFEEIKEKIFELMEKNSRAHTK